MIQTYLFISSLTVNFKVFCILNIVNYYNKVYGLGVKRKIFPHTFNTCCKQVFSSATRTTLKVVDDGRIVMKLVTLYSYIVFISISFGLIHASNITFPDGSIYVGDVDLNDSPFGFGKLDKSSGDVYE